MPDERGDAGVPCHVDDSLVREGAEHHGIHPALYVACDVAHRLAFAQQGAGLVHEERRPAQAGHAGFKGEPRTQRGLLKEQNQLFSGKRATEIGRTVLDDVRQLKQRFRLLRREVL